MPPVNAITLELFKNALASIVDEMSLTIVRTARSNVVRETMDFTTALCDADARVVAQGLGLGLHLGTVPDVVRTVHRSFAESRRPGDLVAVNDPYQGGTHLPDIYLVRPIFLDGTLIGYSVVNMHHVDVGGRVPGSVAPDSTEIFQEGLRLGPVKLVDAGRPNQTLLEVLRANSRLPERVLGDLDAQAAACLIGERGFLRLAARYGAKVMPRYMAALLDYAEQMARQEIAEFPDGVYHFVDHLDDDGITDESVRLAVEITIRGSDLIVDFTGSSPQVRGALNTVMPMTRSSVYCTVRAAMRSNIPDNEGMYRPISVRAPVGTIVNPEFPAAVAARGATAHRICDAVFGALAQAVPERIMAAGEGGSTNISLGGVTIGGDPYVHLEFVYGNWGARPDRDGIDGVSNLFANMANTPIEAVEAENPILIQWYGFVPDTGGAGRYRGGLSVGREYRLLGPEASFAIRSDRRKYRPYGLAGGGDGAPSWNVLDPGPGQRILPTKCSGKLETAQVLRHLLAGGGGYGDPLERDISRVLDDVLDEKITRDAAEATYGVVFCGDGLADTAATVSRRAHLRGRSSSPRDDR